MNYYICGRCGALSLGWAKSVICQKCGGVLKRITREEFYSEREEVTKGGDLKDVSSRHL